MNSVMAGNGAGANWLARIAWTVVILAGPMAGFAMKLTSSVHPEYGAIAEPV